VIHLRWFLDMDMDEDRSSGDREASNGRRHAGGKGPSFVPDKHADADPRRSDCRYDVPIPERRGARRASTAIGDQLSLWIEDRRKEERGAEELPGAVETHRGFPDSV
jgi:hypothetical protein